MRLPYILATLIYCAFIFWMSGQSNPPRPDIGFPGDDKLVHAALFGGLAAVVSIGLHRSGRPYSPRFLFWAPVIFALAYGITDEIHQAFVPLRSPDAVDLIADGTGALFVQFPLRSLMRRHRSLAPS